MTETRARVLIIVENLSMPFDRRAWREARSLARAGYEVLVISPKGTERDRASREVVDGIRIHRYRALEARGGIVSYVVEWVHAVLAIFGLSTLIWVRHGFDVVHICNPPDVLFLALWPFKLLGAKVVFDHHDLSPEIYLAKAEGKASGLALGLLRRLERMTFAFADVVVSANQSYKEIAVGRGRKRESEVFVVRNGPELSQIRDVPEDPTFRQGREHLIVYVGMMGSQDGVDYLLRAIRVLRADLGRDDFHVRLLGGGPELPALRRMAQELEIDDRLTFEGLVVDHARVFAAIRAASVCTCPDPGTALNDSSTLVKVLEYMSMGRPTVAFDLKETRRSAGDSALYATPNDEREFAGRIAELLDSPELRERLGELGRARIVGGLSWDHSTKHLLAAYDAVRTGRTAG